MLNDIRVLSARRAYEFRNDALRLTALATPPFKDVIQKSFGFQLAQVAPPIPTFGEVPPTIPPGLVFNYALWPAQDETSVPIRLLHIEPRRIVIDVAGPSAAISAIYERLLLVVRETSRTLNIYGDTPVIGEPVQVRDYSEITVKPSWRIDSIFQPGVRKLLARAAGVPQDDLDRVLAPTLYLRSQGIHEESSGAVTVPDNRVVQLGTRVGMRMDEQVYYSGTLLDSEAHLAYLRDLDEVLNEQAREVASTSG